MAKVNLSNALFKSGIPHDISWADKIDLVLPDNHLPFEYQYAGANLLAVQERSALFDEAGTGKTLSLQLNAIWRVGTNNKVLGLMPPSLLDQFHTSFFETFPGIGQYVTCEIFSGTVAQRKVLVERYEDFGWPDILLMTYQLFSGTKKRVGERIRMKALDYSVLMADEAQALNNCDSALHKRVFHYIGGRDTDGPNRAALVMATATPSHTRAEDCYGLIRLMTPTAYGSKSEFDRLHLEYESFRIGSGDRSREIKRVVGYNNLDILTMNLYSHARRVEKADVAAEMPPKIHTIVPVKLHSEHKALYKKLLDERMLEVEGRLMDMTEESALRQAAMQIVSNPNKYSDEPVKNAMEEWLMVQLESIDLARTKVFIIIHYLDTADRLKELLKEYNPVVINSTVSNIKKAVKKFKTDPTCRINISHPKSGGAGLNYQAVCHNVIVYECPESPGDLIQAEDRVHRVVGTDNTVNIYFPSPIGTLPAKKIRQIRVKDQNINNVVGDRTALLADLFDE